MKRDLKNMVELKEFLKNLSANLKVPVYTESEDGAKPVKNTKDRVTLKQVVDIMNDKFQKLEAKVDAGFKQVNDRLDYIVSVNNLKDLPKTKIK
ncbi:MAG: hypothetical protein MJ214_04035 [Bacilli bacterium]|nr:hypothetical protein [Bacilli bacterium]